MSVSYFDCTNYYFDIGRSDLDTFNEEGNPVDEKGNETEIKYRKRASEKNHRPDPIVEMGLLMDWNGIPFAFDLFPGNESEKLHMRSIINRVKKEFTDNRILFVANCSLNTSDNNYFLNGTNRAEYNTRRNPDRRHRLSYLGGFGVMLDGRQESTVNEFEGLDTGRLVPSFVWMFLIVALLKNQSLSGILGRDFVLKLKIMLENSVIVC